jgi:hypothetical protein
MPGKQYDSSAPSRYRRGFGADPKNSPEILQTGGKRRPPSVAAGRKI